MSDFDTMPEHTRRGFLYASGIDDVDDGRAHLQRSLDLAELASGMRAPLYLLHGRHDVIFSMTQVDRFREAFGHVPLVIDVEDDGDHCCHNMGQVARPRMADWLADHLLT